MNGTTLTLDRVVPISKARSNLADLVSRLNKTRVVVVSNKYKPAAALVSIPYLEKLLAMARAWQRDQDFRRLDQLRERLPERSPHEVANDVDAALHMVRHGS